MNEEDIFLAIIGLLTAAAVPLIIAWLVVAFIGANVASARGRGSGSWFLMTLIFGPLAILLLALFPVDRDALAARKVENSLMQWCPFCSRAIATNAIKCCHCHSVIHPLANVRRQVDSQTKEESGTPRDGIRRSRVRLGHASTNLDVMSQAIHLCGGGIPPKQVAAQLNVSEDYVRTWVDRYMEDDAWMRRVDMASVHEED